MKEVICELRKEITIMKTMSIKPNFSALAEEYNLDYRTVKRYYNGYDGKPVHHNKKSKLLELDSVIEEKMNLKGAKVSSLYFFLQEEYDYKGSYSNLTYYIRKTGKKPKKKSKGTPRFETKIGEQIQFDWVESITMVNKYGEIFEFNVFSAELSYSRMHYFYYSVTKTREDVIRCLINSFKFFGGVSKEILTDNMSSIINNSKDSFCDEFKAFLKDFNIDGKRCKIRSPNTKGKVEVRNKFIKWLIPFNNSFETEKDIIKVIEKITNKVNTRINSTTNVKPIMLYQKEKEYLDPLPTNQIIENYLNLNISVKVNSASLIYYKGSQYSVSPKYINKTLKIKVDNNKLYIYDSTTLVQTHYLTNQKINYNDSDYKELLLSSMPYKDEKDIEALAKKNLELLEKNTKKEGNKNEWKLYELNIEIQISNYLSDLKNYSKGAYNYMIGNPMITDKEEILTCLESVPEIIETIDKLIERLEELYEDEQLQ